MYIQCTQRTSVSFVVVLHFIAMIYFRCDAGGSARLELDHYETERSLPTAGLSVKRECKRFPSTVVLRLPLLLHSTSSSIAHPTRVECVSKLYYTESLWSICSSSKEGFLFWALLCYLYNCISLALPSETKHSG